MSGGVKRCGINAATTTETRSLRKKAIPQKGEDPSSILSLLCCGLSRSGESGLGHGAVLGRQWQKDELEMPQTTHDLSRIGHHGFQNLDWNHDLSLSPIVPNEEWGEVAGKTRICRYSASTAVAVVLFECFVSNSFSLLLLLPCYHNTTTPVWLTLMVLSSHHGFQDSNPSSKMEVQ